MIKKNAMVYVDEVAETLGIANDTAYKIIKKLNEDLTSMGYVVVAGRLPRKFWEEKFYGGPDALYENDQNEKRKEVAICQ